MSSRDTALAAAEKLIGTEVSLYTGKLRCYLKYKNIPFEDVLSTNDVYKNIIIPRTGVQYIPVLMQAQMQVLVQTQVRIQVQLNR